VLVTTLGDVLLDVIVQLREPFEAGADALATTKTGAGGQAGNVAAWAGVLGAAARCVAKRGEDAAGRVVSTELELLGVELVGPEAGRTGVVVSIVAPDGERTMASDRGAATSLSPADLDPDWFACDCLHISGYSLLESPIDTAALLAAELARTSGARVSVDLSPWTTIRRYGGERYRELLGRIAPDVVFGNEREWDEVGMVAGRRVVKRGADGFTVDGEAWAPRPAEVRDTTGAGDALAAGFLVGGPDLGADAAARCVARLGAMP
jgi:sugar/nucleoside kinase (ribokinase family)